MFVFDKPPERMRLFDAIAEDMVELTAEKKNNVYEGNNLFIVFSVI